MECLDAFDGNLEAIRRHNVSFESFIVPPLNENILIVRKQRVTIRCTICSCVSLSPWHIFMHISHTQCARYPIVSCCAVFSSLAVTYSQLTCIRGLDADGVWTTPESQKLLLGLIQNKWNTSCLRSLIFSCDDSSLVSKIVAWLDPE
uniref:Zf-RVT domain-containing protein n=1 Tax=Ascaris lumbricoides TaxID=6252 RepID=A0A0M3IKR0_ASCLU